MAMISDVRAFRQQLNMTQEQFAHELSVTVSTVNRWENSHASPSRLARRAIEELARRRGLLGSEPVSGPNSPEHRAMQ